MEHSSKYRIPKISLFSIFRDIYVSRKDLMTAKQIRLLWVSLLVKG